MADLYRLLGISRRADGAAIKATYYQLAKQYHPDANAGVEASQRFREIQGAYETLSNPVARAEYDLERAGQRSRARKSFLVGALAGLSTLVLMASLLPALVHRLEPAPTSPRHATRTDEQVASALSSKDMSCEEVIKADLALRAIDGPPQSLPSVSCTAEREPSVETRAQALAYLEREQQEPAYARAVPEPDPPRAASMTTQSASLEVEPAPAIKPKPVRWTLLENAGGGFELKYPADVFAPKPGALEADDRLFVSQDGHSLLRVYANRSSPAMAPSKYRAALLAKRYAGASLDYAPQRANWFVLSGTLGQEMFYERVSFSCDHRSFHGWLITYPVVERQFYDAVVEEMHRTYRYGKAAGWRCGEAGPTVDGVRRLNAEPGKSNKASVLSP
jgi:curved DNA-binding protein CbpA